MLQLPTLYALADRALRDTQTPGGLLHRDSFPLQFPHPIP
jgi:hypothetical protein